jgi:hypothetical protein
LNSFSSGYKITVDWQHVAILKQEIDDYEEKRKPRKSGMDLRLGWLDRRRLLLRLGTSEKEIADATEICYKLRVQREQTSSTWTRKLLRAEKGKESFLHKMTKSLFQKRSKEQTTKG